MDRAGKQSQLTKTQRKYARVVNQEHSLLLVRKKNKRTNIEEYEFEDLESSSIITIHKRNVNLILEISQLEMLKKQEKTQKSSSASNSSTNDYDTMLVYDFSIPILKGIQYIITYRDYKSLDSNSLVNDTIMMFYLHYLLEKHHAELLSRDFPAYVYSTLFYTRLKYENSWDLNDHLASYSDKNIRNWKKAIDKLDYRLLIIPLNETQHWSLVVIYNIASIGGLYDCYVKNAQSQETPTLDNTEKLSDPPMIIYIDSYYNTHRKATDTIKKYLFYEFCTKRGNLHHSDNSKEILGFISQAERKIPTVFLNVSGLIVGFQAE